MSESLRGQLLIAAPQLLDYFRRTVVLVVEHSEEGAMGIVLNRPTETAVSEAVPALAEPAGEESVVYAGGPVDTDAVLALGDFEELVQAATPVTATLGLLDPRRPVPALHRLRVYAGYAGWAAGQLDAEMEQDAWIVTSTEPDDPFSPDDLWPRVVQRKGGEFLLMSTMPIDPKLN